MTRQVTRQNWAAVLSPIVWVYVFERSAGVSWALRGGVSRLCVRKRRWFQGEIATHYARTGKHNPPSYFIFAVVRR